MIMYNSAHPGRIIREWMGEDITVGGLAKHLGITRVTLSNILNGKAGVSATMAIKLSQAFPPTEPRFWVGLQSDYELSRALREKRKPIAPLRNAKAA
jgi:addiction module HigA family antidote